MEVQWFTASAETEADGTQNSKFMQILKLYTIGTEVSTLCVCVHKSLGMYQHGC